MHEVGRISSQFEIPLEDYLASAAGFYNQVLLRHYSLTYSGNLIFMKFKLSPVIFISNAGLDPALRSRAILITGRLLSKSENFSLIDEPSKECLLSHIML